MSSDYFCTVCQRQCWSATYFSNHLKGRPHAETVAKNKRGGGVDVTVPMKKAQLEFHCSLCDTKHRSAFDMKVHEDEDERHRLKMDAIFEEAQAKIKHSDPPVIRPENNQELQVVAVLKTKEGDGYATLYIRYHHK